MPGKTGGIALFRPDGNGKRLQHSAEVLSMPLVPVEMFVRACRAAVALNVGFVPPHETGWGLYCRPILFASGPTISPNMSYEWTFCVYVVPMPLGAQDGAPLVRALILDNFDRAAPQGTGHAKAGGNYAGVMRWSALAKSEGFGITLHLDSLRHEEIDEFSASGFLAVKKRSTNRSRAGNDVDGKDFDVTIVVPDSPTVLASLTSDSVQQIARSFGWNVDKRPVPYTELPTFSEVFAAGTGAGLVPVRSITRRPGIARRSSLPLGPRVVVDPDGSETIVYVQDEQNTEGGPVYQKILAQLGGIQLGKVKDEFGWLCAVRAEDAQLE
jgi:branched-chain amino acid aminotransferase